MCCTHILTVREPLKEYNLQWIWNVHTVYTYKPLDAIQVLAREVLLRARTGDARHTRTPNGKRTKNDDDDDDDDDDVRDDATVCSREQDDDDCGPKDEYDDGDDVDADA